MKIKISKSFDLAKLEENVNSFIEGAEVVSTQLTVVPQTDDRNTQYVVLVTYEEFRQSTKKYSII